MNKSQAEKNVYAIHAVFRVGVNDVKPFQNRTETSPFDHLLDPQCMTRHFKTINRWLIQTAFIDPVSAAYNRGSGWLHAYKNDYVIDNYVEPAVF